MIIYKITNKINGKIYVGLTTTTLKKRMHSYKSESKSDRVPKQSVVFAFKKYGFENFTFEEIDYASTKEELKKKEINYISQLKSSDPSIGYNISLGGNLISDSISKKMSLARKGKPKSEETKRKISESLKGHKMPDNVKQILLAANIGRASWNKGNKGVMKPNSGSFAPGPKGTRRGF